MPTGDKRGHPANLCDGEPHLQRLPLTQGQRLNMVAMTTEKEAASTGHDSPQLGRCDHTVRHFIVCHDDVTIAASRGGQGQPLVLCPGLGSTRAELDGFVELLRRDHDVVTFDLSGHGRSSPADRYCFQTFYRDLVAVIAELERIELPTAPVLVGYSFGADLALHYVADHPGTVAGLVLVDGANPLPEPFIAEADMPYFRALRANQETPRKPARIEDPSEQVALTGAQLLDLDLEIDEVRSRSLDRYRKIDCPISMIMSVFVAGDSGEERALRYNRLWRAGIDRLGREVPHIATFWLDADHRLIFSHRAEIARIIRQRHGSGNNSQVRGD